MEEELITFETAKLAKEKGFHCDLEGMGWIGMCYDKKGKLCDDFYDEHGKEIDTYFKYLAPTQSLLQKWLLEDKHINIELTFDDGSWFIYAGEFSFPDSSVEFVGSVECDSFKHAITNKPIVMEKALQQALKLI